MTREKQQAFVEELIENVKTDLLGKIARVPEEWDGIELRQWIADRFAEVVIKDTMSRARKRAYQNTVLFENL